jgi:hypothetical protein
VVDTDEDDFVRIPRPRSLIKWLLAVLHLQTKRGIARDRGDTITAVAATLSRCGRAGTVVSHQGDDRWQVHLGPADTLGGSRIAERP